MVVDFLPVLKHREEVKSTRDAERHPYFYSKTLVNTEKMLESPDFACTLKETKTTIPISRTPKPINEFGLKPGKYRPSAVKVTGFDPLDANHAASTGGVASRPRQDVQTRKGKHWNERQPNDTAHANDRDGNGLRDREHAGRPDTGPIPAVRPSPDRRRSDGVSREGRKPGDGSRERSCKPYSGPILHTIGTSVFIHGTSPKGTKRR